MPPTSLPCFRLAPTDDARTFLSGMRRIGRFDVVVRHHGARGTVYHLGRAAFWRFPAFEPPTPLQVAWLGRIELPRAAAEGPLARAIHRFVARHTPWPIDDPRSVARAYGEPERLAELVRFSIRHGILSRRRTWQGDPQSA